QGGVFGPSSPGEPLEEGAITRVAAELQKNLTAFQGYQLYAYPLAKIALLEARIAELEKNRNSP
ncbi:hypothetical protein KA016_03715, partial [Candidatus Saccharibacteria bacterium]|nr:hypothetical protein [Candidatus Saccharibacteria bacterium]